MTSYKIPETFKRVGMAVRSVIARLFPGISMTMGRGKVTVPRRRSAVQFDTSEQRGRMIGFTRERALELISSAEPNDRVQGIALSINNRCRDKVVLTRILECMNDEHHMVRHMAASAIHSLRIKQALPLAIRGLKDPAWDVRVECAWTLFRDLRDRAVPYIVDLIYDERPTVAHIVCEMLVNLGYRNKVVTDRMEALEKLPEVYRLLHMRAAYPFK
jgi:HEAT repeat protein